MQRPTTQVAAVGTPTEEPNGATTNDTGILSGTTDAVVAVGKPTVLGHVWPVLLALAQANRELACHQ